MPSTVQPRYVAVARVEILDDAVNTPPCVLACEIRGGSAVLSSPPPSPDEASLLFPPSSFSTLVALYRSVASFRSSWQRWKGKRKTEVVLWIRPTGSINPQSNKPNAKRCSTACS